MLSSGKHSFPLLFSSLRTPSSASAQMLLTKILQLMRAAGGMQWKNISLLPASPSLTFLPSTPPSSLDYITPVCEHSSWLSLSRLTLATRTPRPLRSRSFPLAVCRWLLRRHWLSRASLCHCSLSAHVDWSVPLTHFPTAE